jgi:release factor glutamine methyltransferase
MGLAAEDRRAPAYHPFMQIEIAVSGAVLAPREETELLGREAVRLLRAGPEDRPLVIDMCCGSGNLALGLANALPTAKVFAADLTDDAVAAARANAARLKLGHRVTVEQGDLFEAFAGDGLEGRAAMVVCNPPYISSARLEGESAHLLASEPREAFDGGPYGISIQQRLVRDAARFLVPGGHLLFEFGEGQALQARSLIRRAGSYALLDFPCDGQGVPRVAVARRLEPAA